MTGSAISSYSGIFGVENVHDYSTVVHTMHLNNENMTAKSSFEVCLWIQEQNKSAHGRYLQIQHQKHDILFSALLFHSNKVIMEK